MSIKGAHQNRDSTVSPTYLGKSKYVFCFVLFLDAQITPTAQTF